MALEIADQVHLKLDAQEKEAFALIAEKHPHLKTLADIVRLAISREAARCRAESDGSVEERSEAFMQMLAKAMKRES